MPNSIRIAALVVFATAALITLAAYHKRQPQQNIDGIDTPSRLRKGSENRHQDSAYLSIPKMKAPHNFSVDSQVVTRAAEAVRLALNSQRHLQCPDIPAYSQLTRVDHVKGSVSARGIEKYVLELTFDHSAPLHAIVRRNASKPDQPSDDSDRFSLVSSVPGPCDREHTDLLAVSYTGLTCKMVHIEVQFLCRW